MKSQGGENIKSLLNKKSSINVNGDDYDIEVIEISDIMQPFKEDQADEIVNLKSMNTSSFKEKGNKLKKTTTKSKAKKTKSKVMA